jgi:exopolyphosphatase / guanosine-5'-triphosphate,3'-diphosphate pyrophosphatase
MATRAVIDIGTNSTKLLVGKVDRGVITPVYRARDVTRLSENFFESRRLRAEAIGRTAEAVSRFVSHALRYDPDSIRIVATSAARDALNRAELISAIERGTGIKAEIISGEQEAQWAYDGVLSEHAFARRAAVVFDLGAGSTELILGENGIARARRSYPFGAIRLFQSLKPVEPPSVADLTACRRGAMLFVRENIVPQLGPALTSLFCHQFLWIGCGGTVSALARILCRGKFDSRTSTFQLAALRALISRLWSIPREQRVAEGVAATRVDSILTGAVIVESLMLSFDVAEISVSSHGVRHGALLADPEREAAGPSFSANTELSFEQPRA